MVINIIFIIIFFSGCSFNKDKQTIEEKIPIEVQYLDKRISEFLSKIIGDIEESEKVQEENQKVQSVGSGSSESSKKTDSSSNGENSNNKESSESSSEEITSMSMQYKEISEMDNSSWNDVKNGVEDLYVSWAIVESDLLTKNEIKQEDLDKISHNIDNLIIATMDENKVNFIKESADMYNNIILVLEKINYNKNKLGILKVKKKIYEAYSYILEDNWDGAGKSLNDANNQLKEIDNLEEKIKVVFNNLSNSVETRNKKIYFIKCSDAINELEYINF